MIVLCVVGEEGDNDNNWIDGPNKFYLKKGLEPPKGQASSI